MASRVLRRVNKAQLLELLRRSTAAPFHTIIWDNRPMRLGDAVGLLERAPDDSFYYANPRRVFSGAVPMR
jgi:hypothetical protein